MHTIRNDGDQFTALNGTCDITFHFAELENIDVFVDDSIFAQRMLVDYARVYRLGLQ